MSVKINKKRLVIRNDVASKWMSKNPILLQGEMGFERDTRKFKLGDGKTTWNELSYANITDLNDYYTKEEIYTKEEVDGIKAELKQLIQNEEKRAEDVETSLSNSIGEIDDKITQVKDKVDNMVVEETDPNVPAWAKEPTKPTYTPEEIGDHGVVALDENGKVPSSYLPSYVDDVVEGFFSANEFYSEKYTGTIDLELEKVNTIYFNTIKYSNADFFRLVERFIHGTSTKVETYKICTFKSGAELIFKRDHNSTYHRTKVWIYLLYSDDTQKNLFYYMLEQGQLSGNGVFNSTVELPQEDEIIKINIGKSTISDYISFHPFTYYNGKEAGKIFVDTENNKTYRWSGSTYVEISPSLALGETSSTAYSGDKGSYNRTKINEITNQLTSLQPKESSSLNTTDKTIVGAINEIKENQDSILEDSNNYTDEKFNETTEYIDSKSSQVLTNAKSYTDLKISQIEISGGGGSSSGSGGGIVEVDKSPSPGAGGDSIEDLFEKGMFETECEKLYFNIGLTDEELNKDLEQKFSMYSYDEFIEYSMYLFEFSLTNGERNYSIDFIKGDNQEKAIYLKEFDSDWNLIREIPIWCNQEMYELSNSDDWPFDYAYGLFNEKSGWYIEESLYPLEDKFFVYPYPEAVGIISTTSFNEKPLADSNVIYKETKQEVALYYNDSYYGYGVEDFKETIKRYTNGDYQLNYQKIDILDVSLMEPVITNENTINIYIYNKTLWINNDSNLLYNWDVLEGLKAIFQNYGYNYGFFDSGYFPISNKDIMKKYGPDTVYLYTSPEKEVTYKNSIGDDYVEFSTNKNPQTIQEVESLPGKTVKSGTALQSNTDYDKIYFNLKATDEDIIPIFEKMSNEYYWDGSFMGGHYVNLFSNNGISLVRCNPGENTYYYISFNIGSSAIDRVDGSGIMWASKGCNAVNSSIIDGWNPNYFNNESGELKISKDVALPYNGYAKEIIELIKDLISSTPFEETFIPDATTNQKVIYKTPDGKLSNFNGKELIEISTSKNAIALQLVKELPDGLGKINKDSGASAYFGNNEFVEKVYFNIDLSIEEVYQIFEDVTGGSFPNNRMGLDYDYVFYAYNNSDGQDRSIYLCRMNGTNYNNPYFISIKQYYDINAEYGDVPVEHVIWASEDFVKVAKEGKNWDLIPGWQQWIIDAGGVVEVGTNVDSSYTSSYADSFTSVVSGTEYKKDTATIKENILYKTPDNKYHNYNGEKYIELSTSENPITIKTVEELPETQLVEILGTELPTDGSIPTQIHFNLDATDGDILPILQELNFYMGSGKYDEASRNRYSVTIVNNITDFDFNSDSSSEAIVIYWYQIGSDFTNGVYLIGLYNLANRVPNDNANRIIWASKGTVEAVNWQGYNVYCKDGWQDWVIEANGILNIGGTNQSLTDNAQYYIPLLKNIISSAPFEEKKYPNPDLNDQPIYKTFSSKEITNPENGFRMYFNGEDVSVRLSDDNGSEVDVRFYIEKDFPTDNIKNNWIDGEDGNPGISNNYLINNEIYYAWQNDNEEWVFELNTWLLDVFGTAQYKIVSSLDKATESDILYVVVPNENCIFENPKYYILDKTTGHKLELGSGGGSSIETVEELPYVTNEGTAVPESGLVEKIYFNTKMDPIDVAKILGTLDYYDLSSVGINFPAAVIHTSADMSIGVIAGDFSGTDYKSYYIIYQSSEGEKIVYEYSESPAESAVADDWVGIENIDINVENMLGVLGPQFGVANQNDKVKNIISAAPFEDWNKVNNQTIYKVQKQTDGEYEKPQYYLFDSNTQTQTNIGGVGIKDLGEYTTDGDPINFEITQQLFNELKNNNLFVKILLNLQLGVSGAEYKIDLTLTKSGAEYMLSPTYNAVSLQFNAIIGGTIGASSSQSKIYSLIVQEYTDVETGAVTYPATLSFKNLD